MIVGRVDENIEARVTLSLLNRGAKEDISFLVDSGFNGYLAIPESVVRQLNLPLATVQRGATADGRVSYFDTVDVCVIWDGNPTNVRAQVLDEPLIGTRMLRGFDMQVRWEVGGVIQLTPVSS
jgi:clan AA aspartic protease